MKKERSLTNPNWENAEREIVEENKGNLREMENRKENEETLTLWEENGIKRKLRKWKKEIIEREERQHKRRTNLFGPRDFPVEPFFHFQINQLFPHLLLFLAFFFCFKK